MENNSISEKKRCQNLHRFFKPLSSNKKQNKIKISEPFSTLNSEQIHYNNHLDNNNISVNNKVNYLHTTETNKSHTINKIKRIEEKSEDKSDNHILSKDIRYRLNKYDTVSKSRHSNRNKHKNKNRLVIKRNIKSQDINNVPININIQNVHINNYYNFSKQKKDSFPIIGNNNLNSNKILSNDYNIIPDLKSRNNIILNNNNINVVNIINGNELNSSDLLKKIKGTNIINNYSNNNITNNLNINNNSNVNNNNSTNNNKNNTKDINNIENSTNNNCVNVNTISNSNTINDVNLIKNTKKTLKLFKKISAFRSSSNNNDNFLYNNYNYCNIIKGHFKKSSNSPIKTIITKLGNHDSNFINNIKFNKINEFFNKQKQTSKITDSLQKKEIIDNKVDKNKDIIDKKDNTIDNKNIILNKEKTGKNNKIVLNDNKEKSIDIKKEIYNGPVEDSFIDELNILLSGVEDKKNKNNDNITKKTDKNNDNCGVKLHIEIPNTEEQESENINILCDDDDNSDDNKLKLDENLKENEINRMNINNRRPGTSYGGLNERYSKLRSSNNPKTPKSTFIPN